LAIKRAADQSARSTIDLSQGADLSNLVVGTQVVGDRQQVFVEREGIRRFITNDERNHLSPQLGGSKLVWTEEQGGSSQVVVYDLVSKERVQLSQLRSNSAPVTDGSIVAWQGLSGDEWSVYVYDTKNPGVKKLSGNDPAIRPFVYEGKVLFTKQIDKQSDMWQTVLYDSSNGELRSVTEGTAAEAAYPRFENGQIKTGLEGSGAFYQ
jgi:Tol biopolymer transport system component